MTEDVKNVRRMRFKNPIPTVTSPIVSAESPTCCIAVRAPISTVIIATQLIFEAKNVLVSISFIKEVYC